MPSIKNKSIICYPKLADYAACLQNCTALIRWILAKGGACSSKPNVDSGSFVQYIARKKKKKKRSEKRGSKYGPPYCLGLKKYPLSDLSLS